MKVYIARHGQVSCNVLKVYSNPYDDLTQIGIKQAEELRDKIKDNKFDIIYVSPYKRAIHTAEIINVNNTKTIIDDRLKERDCGSLSGKPYNGNEDRAEYWNYFSSKQYGTSEKIIPFFKRIYSFIDELKEKDYENVLIVAHSGVSKAFSAYFEGIKDGKFIDRGLKNCEIKMYDI